MGSIVSTGAGSGLDVAGIVKKLVESEGAPKTARLDTAEAKIQAKLSALGSLRSALAGFRDTVGVLKQIDRFQSRQATLSSKDFIAATASSTAVPGTYSVDVENLAQAHKIQSQPLPAADPVGTGTLTIETADQTYSITIDGTNNTVAGIAAAINASSARAKVFATVVTGATGAVLALTARSTGDASEITLSQSGDAGLTSFVAGFDEVQEALDAHALIDDVEVASTTNTISGAIAGVEITLLKETGDDDESTVLTVGFDRAAARKSIDDFVKSYNGLVDAVNAVASYNPETKEGGPLFGDAGVRNIVFQLRRELTSAVAGVDGSFDMLNEIGITAQLDGKLSVNSTKLDAAFAANFDAIGALFSTKDVGVAVKLDTLLQPYLQSGGVFDSRAASLKSSISDIGDQREALNTRLEAIQKRYLKEFNALDGLLAQLQSTSNFLTQQLSRPMPSLLDN